IAMVVGMGDRNRIERIGKGAVAGRGYKHQCSRARLEQGYDKGEESGSECGSSQYVATIGPVRDAPGRQLHGSAGYNHETHHEGDHRRGTVDADALYSA